MATLNKIKVLLYVQHLHGLGHVFRASRLAQALHLHNFDVHIAWGGRSVSSLSLDPDIDIMHLPSLYRHQNHPDILVDEQDQPVSTEYLDRRRAQLLTYFHNVSPDILITEMYPFGRRQMRFELEPLLKAAGSSPKPVLRVCSVRDIIQQNRKPSSHQDTLNSLDKDFDLVLVHGDKNFVALDETVPGLEALQHKIIYTGFIAPEKNSMTITATENPPEVLISGGGGAAGLKLMKTALQALPICKKYSSHWLMSTGPYLPEKDFMDLKKSASDKIKIVRFVDEFSDLIQKAKASVSLAGYNTVTELLTARCPSVLIPSVSGGETEQIFRANKLQQKNWALTIHPDELTPKLLADKIERLDSLDLKSCNININGAQNSALLLKEHYLKAQS